MFKKFIVAYSSAIIIIVLLLIIGQALIQFTLYYEIQSRLTATSVGRQQLRVQKMTKDILALEDKNITDKSFYLKEIKNQDIIWEKTQVAIQHGDSSLAIPSHFSSDVMVYISKSQPDYVIMQESIQKILFIEKNHLAEDELYLPIHNFSLHISEYADCYSQIFALLVYKADSDINAIQWMEAILFCLALGVMFFEVFYIVIPETRVIQKNYDTGKLVIKTE